MFFPGAKIIDQEGVVIAAVVRDDLLLALADDVQLLIDSEAKPRTGKREGWPWNRRQAEDIAIERDAAVNIGDVDCDVVELGDDHRDQKSGDRSQRSGSFSFVDWSWVSNGVGRVGCLTRCRQ